MSKSSTFKTIYNNGYGYRNDDLYENINKPFLDIMTFEVEELCNTDIIDTIYSYYLSKETHLPFSLKNLSDTIISYNKDFDEMFSEEGVPETERLNAYRLLNEYVCRKLGYRGNTNLYCKWLTTKQGYKNSYANGEEYVLTKYKFDKGKSMIVSDLGLDGVLVVSLKPFEKIEEKYFSGN